MTANNAARSQYHIPRLVGQPHNAASGNVPGLQSPDAPSVNQQFVSSANAGSPNLTTSTRGQIIGAVPLGTPAASQVVHQNPQYPTQPGGSQTNDMATFDKMPFGSVYTTGGYDPNFDYASLANNLVGRQNFGNDPETVGSSLTRVASSGMANNEFKGINVQRSQNIPLGNPEDLIQRDTIGTQHVNEGKLVGRVGIDVTPGFCPR